MEQLIEEDFSCKQFGGNASTISCELSSRSHCVCTQIVKRYPLFFGHAGLFFSALMCCNAEKSLLPIHGKERWKLYRSIHMYRLFLTAVYKAERREIRFFPWPSTPISAPFSRVIPARQGRKVDLFSSYAGKKQLLPNYFF